MFGGGFQFSSQQPKTATTGLTFGTQSSTTTTPALLPSLTGCTTSGTMFGSGFSSAVTTTTSTMFRGISSTFTPSAAPTGIFSGIQPKTTAFAGPNLGFGVGLTATTTATPGLNIGLGGTAVNTLTTPSHTTSFGLGGVDISQSSTGLAGSHITSGQSDSKAAVKETVLPNEISQSLEIFKKYVKEQKIIREEITRVSSKPILKVQEETTALKQMLSIVSNGLHRNAVAIEKLKQETAQELKNAEIAQRTKDTPPTLQYENTAPVEYFQHLVTSFEKQMQLYRQQIEQLEKHIISVSQPTVLTQQELTTNMRKLHEAFVALAAHLQMVHEALQQQKEQFLCYKRLVDGDTSNIFESLKRSNIRIHSTISIPVTVGPAPFSNTPSPAAIAMAAALNRTQQPAGLGTGSFGTPSNIFSGSSLNLGGSSTVFKPLGSFNTGSMFSTGFGTSLLGNPTGGEGMPQTPYPVSNQNKPFQLQKPPMGNKRGKRWTST